MHSQESKTRTAGVVKHPTEIEWMGFLYEELPAPKRRELGVHLANCPACVAQLQTWRASMDALDEWALPATRAVPRPWWPKEGWAAAAALLLGACFILGRQTSPAAAELANLKASVARLEQSAQREGSFDPAETLEAATTAANNEVVRLLAEFTRLQDEQRAGDRQRVTLSLRTFESRIAKLRAELETVALNTESGFEQTHENFTHLVSLSVPAKVNEPR